MIAIYVVALVLAVYFVTPDPTGDIKELITCWAALLLCLGWIVAARRAGIAPRRPRAFREVVLGLLILYLIASLRSEYRMTGLLEFFRFASLAGLYYVASQVYRTPAQIRPLLWTLLGTMAVASTYAFMQAAGYDPLPWLGRESDVYTNLPSTFGNPNFAAHTIILVMIMGLYLAWQAVPRGESGGEGEPKPRRALRWLVALWLVAYIAFHLHATDQRGGLVALAAAFVLVAVALTVGRRLRRPVIAVVVTVVLTGIIGAIGLGGAMGLAKARTGSVFPLDTSLLVRYQSYVSATSMVLDAPLGGHGPGAYKYTYPAYWTDFERNWFAQENRMNAHVHNDLLEAAIDAGLPAAGCYLALLVLGVCYGLLLAFHGPGRERKAFGYACAAFFCAFAVDGLFGFNLRVPVSAGLLFLVLGALEGLWSPPEEGEAKQPRWSAHLLRWTVVAVLLAGAVLEARYFAARVHLYRGVHLAHDFKRADRELARAQQLAPWDAWIARERAGLAFNHGAEEAAAGHYAAAFEADPHHILTNLPMAQLKRNEATRLLKEDPERVDEALRLLDASAAHAQRVLDISPAHPIAEDYLGRIAASRATIMGASGDRDYQRDATAFWEKAGKHLARAISLGAPHQTQLYLLLARTRIACDDQNGAEEAFVRAAQTDAWGGEAWSSFFAWAGITERYDRLRQALEDQISRLRDHGGDSAVLVEDYLYLASVLDNGYQDVDGATRAYLNAVELAPNSPTVWVNFERFAQRRHVTDTLAVAIGEACDALTARGETPLPQLAAVDGAVRHGAPAFNAATALLLNAAKSRAPHPGLTLEQELGWAVRALANALRHGPPPTPETATAYLNLAMAHARLGWLEEADRLFAIASQVMPQARRGALATHWADVLVRLERNAEATNLLLNARENHPGDLELRCALARCLARGGRIDEARSEYEALLAEPDIDPRGRTMLQTELEAL